MTDVDFRWDIRGGTPQGGGMCVLPESILEGTVTVTPQSDLDCKNLSIRLAWHTEGRGDRDQQTVDGGNVFQGALPAGQPASFAFRFSMPNQPWSYRGHYINIVWELIAEIDLPLAVNPKSSYPLLLRPEVV